MIVSPLLQWMVALDAILCFINMVPPDHVRGDVLVQRNAADIAAEEAAAAEAASAAREAERQRRSGAAADLRAKYNLRKE